MKLTKSQRDQVVEALTWDMVKQLTEWAINGERDELYNYVVATELLRRQDDYFLVDHYHDVFQKWPEWVDCAEMEY